jgi:hypothetical protein
MPDDLIKGVEFNTEFAIARKSTPGVSQKDLYLKSLSMKKPADISGSFSTESEETLTNGIQITDKFLATSKAVGMAVAIIFGKRNVRQILKRSALIS